MKRFCCGLNNYIVIILMLLYVLHSYIIGTLNNNNISLCDIAIIVLFACLIYVHIAI